MARILIIEDQPADRELLVVLLGYHGHAVLEACDGAEGLALTLSEHPDLVITDLMMPGMDGYEFAQRFRSTFEQAAVGIAHVAPTGHWLRVNQRLCEIVGYTRAELSERSFQDVTYPGDLDADLAYVQQMLAGDITTYSMEKRYIRKD